MAVTTTSTSAKLSFADIVKGSTTPTPTPALQPGKRGDKQCYCLGEVLVMLGHYGWIKTFEDIDHPDLEMTGGRVYVHKRDVVHGIGLTQGDVVSFYLYSDNQGLGAECCQVDQSASRSLCADAEEFVPSCVGVSPSWNMSAAEFAPTPTSIPNGFSMEAAEFIPSNFSAMDANIPEFIPSNFSAMDTSIPEFIPASVCSNAVLPNASITAINLAFLCDSDSESDDESSIVSSKDFDADKESDADDTDSSCYDILDSLQDDWASKAVSDLHVAKYKNAPWRKLSQVPLDDDSTSAGTVSESESDSIVHCAVRAPPGLSLPAGCIRWRAAPGLSLTALVA